ncbi:FUSC family protein [Marmoricola sp. RAF53]|uniref:FUSC family protein n=1 Tax=Marmoricola sp. RAF53 TaxID=3233059 RepID=UPI003F9C8CDB
MAESTDASSRNPYLDLALTRGRTSLRARVARLRTKSWQIGQCAVAAGVAWFVAGDLFGHPTPFFAPVTAVVSLGTTYGQRLRRVAEVTLGVAVGVFLGDLFTNLLGSGGWQIALIVSLAMVSALLLDAGAIFVTQAAVQSIVVSALVPAPGDAFLRWTDALIGGGVALVAATVVPRAPLRRPREQAAVVVGKISVLLRASAMSIEDGDVERALRTLADARSTDALVAELRGAADEGLSVLASSPFRWRHRPAVRRMVELVEPLDFALRNTRVLARRVAVACYRGEPIPHGYAVFLRDLAAVADTMAAELKADRMASVALDPLIHLGRASSQLERTSVLSAEVVLASVRSLIADLLAVGGMDPLAATDEIPPFPES